MYVDGSGGASVEPTQAEGKLRDNVDSLVPSRRWIRAVNG